MYNQDFFFQAFIYFAAAVIAVPVTKKLGLGSVLGYLVAGIIIGPSVLGLVGYEADKVMHFAEFGVVLMLFVIGLELQPSLLWKMRRVDFWPWWITGSDNCNCYCWYCILIQFQNNQSYCHWINSGTFFNSNCITNLNRKRDAAKSCREIRFFSASFSGYFGCTHSCNYSGFAALNGNIDLIHNSELNDITPMESLPGWMQLTNYCCGHCIYHFCWTVYCPAYFQACSRNRYA